MKRSASYFIHLGKPYEMTGPIGIVCFAERLVYFKEKCLLYYGTADSRIAVATYNP